MEIVVKDITTLLDLYFFPALALGLGMATVVKPGLHLLLERMGKNGNLEHILILSTTLIIALFIGFSVGGSDNPIIIIEHYLITTLLEGLAVAAIAILIVNNWPVIIDFLTKIYRPKERKRGNDDTS